MAGPFGFEVSKYEVSQACGERVLLPAVRNAPADQLVIADGFSCREQIRQNTDRYPLHLADVLKMALANAVPRTGRPEAQIVKQIRSEAAIGKLKTGAAAVALLGTAAFAVSTFFGRNRGRSNQANNIQVNPS